MKVLFMGTPTLARTILEALVKAGHEIVAVYTQPDRPRGRSGEPVPPPVKEYALEMGFTVEQPEKIKKPEEVENLKKYSADVFVVAAYGQILSEEILNMPRYCCINAHGSLLPKLRGAAPIQRAIASGDRETGITVQRMDKGCDTGDIMAQVTVPIEDTDDEASMYIKLADAGAELVLKVLDDIEAGTATYTKQDDLAATHAPMLSKEEGLLNFNTTARLADCKIRGFREWPTAYTYSDGKFLKVLEAKPSTEVTGIGEEGLEPGEILVTRKKLFVMCSDGLLELVKVKPEGKKVMAAMDFARGARLETGNKLGTE